MLTELQKKTSQAIVNIFETGRPLGDYSSVSVIPGDLGHLSYGRSQTTLASGNLCVLIKDYCEAPQAHFADRLSPYVETLEHRDTALDRDAELHRILREAGSDPVMQVVQDRFFDRLYWEPGVELAVQTGIGTALGVTVVYDSRVHGSWGRMRDRTRSRYGPLSVIGEEAWIGHYLDTRREWLAGHSNQLLHKTVYRMDALRKLIREDKWGLQLPLRVRGIAIDESVLEGGPVAAPVDDEATRFVMLRSPFMKGENVRAVQQALAGSGISVQVDGVFGPDTDKAVREFQTRKGLKSDGIVGPATRAALGL